jgi:hypothetical protein
MDPVSHFELTVVHQMTSLCNRLVNDSEEDLCYKVDIQFGTYILFIQITVKSWLRIVDMTVAVHNSFHNWVEAVTHTRCHSSEPKRLDAFVVFDYDSLGYSQLLSQLLSQSEQFILE